MQKTILSILLMLLFALPNRAQNVVPADLTDFVTVGKDGHLQTQGKRIRFWGVISFVGENSADNAAVAVRYKDMGFNLARLWTDGDAWKPNVKGDGSSADRTDNLIAELKKQNLHIWATVYNERGNATSADVNAYTGFFAQYGGAVVFGNGIVLRDILVVNPLGIAYPVTPKEKYVAFTIASMDGLPLATTKKAVLSCVSTSFNEGFTLDESKIVNEFGWWLNPGATKNRGGEKVLVARVAEQFDCAVLNGMRYTLRDWHMRSISSGTVTMGKFQLPADKPIFCAEFTR